MLARFKRYLKRREGFKTEWCAIVIPNVLNRTYEFYMPFYGQLPSTNRLDNVGWSGSYSYVWFNSYIVFKMEDENNGPAGFYHTHPPHLGDARPSATDITTMRAWVTCLGRPLLCYIDNGWDIACWLFDQHGYFRARDLEPANDPLEGYDGRIITRGQLQGQEYS